MKQTYTKHASIRSQQRGIPPLVSDWLMDYGTEVHDGNGGIVRYFTPQSVRKIEKEIGREPVRRMSEFFRCYLVESVQDGSILTIGKRHQTRRLARN